MRALFAPVLLVLLSGCGSFSRATLATREVQADEHADLSPLLGSEPMLPGLWYLAASRAPTPQEALAVVERGLGFHPGHPELAALRLVLLAQLDRREAEVAGATLALGDPGPASAQLEFLGFRVDSHLALDDPFAAARDVTALGSVPNAPPALVASAWAAVALAYQVAGSTQAADAALDSSLSRGERGLLTLRQQAAQAQDRSTAAKALVLRAQARHPANPDLQFYLVVQALIENDATAAQALLEALPEPLPERMQADRAALEARLALLQGRVDDAVSGVLARLDEHPAETGAVAVLIECWRKSGRPSDAVLEARLQAALPWLADRALSAAVASALDELGRRHSPSKAEAPPAREATPSAAPSR